MPPRGWPPPWRDPVTARLLEILGQAAAELDAGQSKARVEVHGWLAAMWSTGPGRHGGVGIGVGRDRRARATQACPYHSSSLVPAGRPGSRERPPVRARGLGQHMDRAGSRPAVQDVIPASEPAAGLPATDAVSRLRTQLEGDHPDLSREARTEQRAKSEEKGSQMIRGSSTRDTR